MKQTVPRRASRPRGSFRSRGISLIEVMIASVVLALGMVATFAMLERVEGANRSFDLTQTANDAYARLAAQIRDAQCDFDGATPAAAPNPATIDDGLERAVGLGYVGVDVPVPQPSTITYVGLTDGSQAPRIPQTVPPLRIEYQVLREAPPVAAPGAVRAPPPNPGPAYDINVRIRQITGDPARDDPSVENGWWIKHYPVKKVCNARYESSSRGEVP